MQLNPFHKNFLKTKVERDTWQIHRLHELAGSNMALSFQGGLGGECARLCQKYGTDKGAIDISTHAFGRIYQVHNYAPFYELIFGQKRKHIYNVLECGIGTIKAGASSAMGDKADYRPGASLYMWQEYFPNAQIIGVDIDNDILFNDERIATYQCDQTDPQSIRAFLSHLDDRKFDIVIDDGLHESHAGITFFENVIDRLHDDGVYVIEDVDFSLMTDYAEYFSSDYSVRFILDRCEDYSFAGLVVITKVT